MMGRVQLAGQGGEKVPSRQGLGSAGTQPVCRCGQAHVWLELTVLSRGGWTTNSESEGPGPRDQDYAKGKSSRRQQTRALVCT